MTRPDVTVVVPAYNARRTLAACLEAILAQTYPPAEVIVVDDRSTDDTVDIAARYPVTVLRQSVNQGPSAARNAGAAAATTELLCYVDADIALAPDAIEQGVAVLAADPGIALVHGLYDTEPLIDDGPVERYKTLHNHHWRRRAVGEVRTALVALAVARRGAIVAAGGFDESLRDGEDVEISGRLARYGRIVLTDRMIGRHDDADTLRAVLSEQFRRSRQIVPMAIGQRRQSRTAPPAAGTRAPNLTAHHPSSLAYVAGGLATLPAVAVSPWLAAVPAAAIVASYAADPGLLRLARRVGGLRFAAFTAVLHTLAQLTVITAAGYGAAAWLLGRRDVARRRPVAIPSSYGVLGRT